MALIFWVLPIVDLLFFELAHIEQSWQRDLIFNAPGFHHESAIALRLRKNGVLGAEVSDEYHVAPQRKESGRLVVQAYFRRDMLRLFSCSASFSHEFLAQRQIR